MKNGESSIKKDSRVFFSSSSSSFFLSYQLEWNLGGNYWENNREGIICVLARTKRWSKVKYGMGWVCLIYTCRAKRGGGRKMNRSSDVYIVLTRELEKLKSR